MGRLKTQVLKQLAQRVEASQKEAKGCLRPGQGPEALGPLPHAHLWAWMRARKSSPSLQLREKSVMLALALAWPAVFRWHRSSRASLADSRAVLAPNSSWKDRAAGHHAGTGGLGQQSPQAMGEAGWARCDPALPPGASDCTRFHSCWGGNGGARERFSLQRSGVLEIGHL